MGVIDEAPPTALPPRRRWSPSPALIISIAVHLLFLAGAGYYVVSRYSAARKLTFHGGPKSPNPSERALQHRVQVEKVQSRSQPAAVPKRVLTTSAAKVTLPPMPDLPTTKNAPEKMTAGAPGSGFASSALMAGGAVGGTGSGTAINFFGIRDTASSVVIMIDVSDSMFGRTGDVDYKTHKLVRTGKEQSFQAVRDEAIKLVQSLTPNVLFGIVRWSASARVWKKELVPATDENKAAAIAHIQNEVDYHSAPRTDRPGGTRHDYALEEAFKLKPETIYMLTDGQASGDMPSGQPLSAQDLYKIVDDAEKPLPKKARLHAIYYLNGKEKPEEKEMLRQLSSRTGGQFRAIKAVIKK